MGSIHLVRHGQAAFGTDDYDRLTETGFNQAQLLGAHFVQRGIGFDAAFTGTLRRHSETLEGILAGMRDAGARATFAQERFGALDEYDPDALIEALTGSRPSLDRRSEERDPQRMREHFRVLRDALLAWSEGQTVPRGMPSWIDFQQGALSVLDRARERHVDGAVLIVSSGGPIAAVVSGVLQAPPSTAVELNLRVRNSGVTEFATTARRHHLVGFNSVAHLEARGAPELVTFA